MSAASTAAAGAKPPGTRRPARSTRAVPAHARQLAAQLSTLFQRDVEIVQRLNDAHRRLHDANERLSSGLRPTRSASPRRTAAAIAPARSPR